MWAAGIIFANLLEEHVPCLKSYALTARDLYRGDELVENLSTAMAKEPRYVFYLWLQLLLIICSHSALGAAAAVVCALLQTDPFERASAEAALRLLQRSSSQVTTTPSSKKIRQPLQQLRANSIVT